MAALARRFNRRICDSTGAKEKNRMSPILESMRQDGCRFMIRPELSKRLVDHVAVGTR